MTKLTIDQMLNALYAKDPHKEEKIKIVKEEFLDAWDEWFEEI